MGLRTGAATVVMTSVLLSGCSVFTINQIDGELPPGAMPPGYQDVEPPPVYCDDPIPVVGDALEVFGAAAVDDAWCEMRDFSYGAAFAAALISTGDPNYDVSFIEGFLTPVATERWRRDLADANSGFPERRQQASDLVPFDLVSIGSSEPPDARSLSDPQFATATAAADGSGRLVLSFSVSGSLTLVDSLLQESTTPFTRSLVLTLVQDGDDWLIDDYDRAG